MVFRMLYCVVLPELVACLTTNGPTIK